MSKGEAGQRTKTKTKRDVLVCTSCPHLGDGARVEVVVVDTVPAGVSDLDGRGTRRRKAIAGLEVERDDAGSHGDLEDLDSGIDSLGESGVVTGGDGDLAAALSHRSDKDRVLDHVPAGGLETAVVGVVALNGLEVGAVPVDQALGVDDGLGLALLEGLDVGDREVEHGGVVEACCPLRRAVVRVGVLVGADVVRLSIVVPGDDLDKVDAAVAELENLVPTDLPQHLGVEQPVLRPRDLATEVGADWDQSCVVKGSSYSHHGETGAMYCFLASLRTER